MIKNYLKLNYTILIIFLVSLGLFMISGSLIAAVSPNFQLKIFTTCGNNVKEPGETCDGTDLNKFSCSDFGFSNGDLSCLPSCESFDKSSCRNGGIYTPPVTAIMFEGWAYPNSLVTLLKDGQVATTTVANITGGFQIIISDIAGGNYSFIIYSEDHKGNRSSLDPLSVVIFQGGYTKIAGIIVTPTIMLDKNDVKKGDGVNISGQAVSGGIVEIVFDSLPGLLKRIQTDSTGKYTYMLNTKDLRINNYSIKSKVISPNGQTSLFSPLVSLNIGTSSVVLTPPGNCQIRADLNNDCRVNLVDFSIAAYWYKRPFDTVFQQLEDTKLNGDGKIDLTDFSIIAFYWTG